MSEPVEEENYNKSHNHNQLRTNLIKTKKNSLAHDREYLYAQNLELKTRIKELNELNMKLKTQLSITEKQKVNLCNIAEEQAFNARLGPRGHSSHHKKSGTNIPPYNQNNLQVSFNSLNKEKQNATFKKLLREQTIEIEKLNNQNQRLKKTMKFTRMNQLLAENKQLMEETLRLKAILAEKKEAEKVAFNDFINEIETLKKKLTQEKDTEKRNGFELKKQLETNADLKEKLIEVQTKKNQIEKRLNKENKQLRNQLTQLKSRLYEQTILKGRDCERQDCIKNNREKNQLKKKNDSLNKEVKRLKEEIQQLRRQTLHKKYESQRVQPERQLSKTPEKAQKSLSNSAVHKKESNNKNENKSSQVTVKKQDTKPGEKSPEKQSVLEAAIVESENEKKHDQGRIELVPPRIYEHEVKPVSILPKDKCKKTQNNHQEDSMDTQKLLASVQGEQNHQLILNSAHKLAEKNKTQENASAEVKQAEKNIAESDGEYEQLNYQQFQEDEHHNPKGGETKEKHNKKLQKKSKASIEQQEDHKDKKNVKKKDKSKKKVSELAEDQQLLYKANAEKQGEKAQQADKAELKLIRETLVYKFMAQNYSYDNFCQDIKENGQIQQFSISDILSLLGAEPFLLEEHQIQTAVIYIFDSDQLTGQEVLTAKDFMKKMKKFIGKAKPIDEASEASNIERLSEIVQKDMRGGKKLKDKFAEHDQGDGTIHVDNFSKVMNTFKVKDQLLQTAIAQIAYVSQDLHHLNYDFFLRRFLEQ